MVHYHPLSHKKPAAGLGLIILALAAVFSTWTLAGIDGISVKNFGKVNDYIYRGGQPTGEGFEDLKRLGIKTVIDLRQEDRGDETELVRSLGMNYINIPMDDHDRPYDDQVAKFLALVKDNSKGPFFVHCAGGRHRTGVMTAAYRMTVDGWDADRAYEEMKDYGFFTAFGHKAYKTYVYDYYNHRQQTHAAAAADTKAAAERSAAGAARN